MRFHASAAVDNSINFHGTHHTNDLNTNGSKTDYYTEIQKFKLWHVFFVRQVGQTKYTF